MAHAILSIALIAQVYRGGSTVSEAKLTDQQRPTQAPLWWGVVGTISHARGSLDRGPALGDIWAQLQFEIYTDVRRFVRRTRRAELRRWRDFGLIEK